MKLEEINSEWARDAPIDLERLEYAAIETPVLHAKYLRLRSDENMMLRKLEHELSELETAKIDRLTGVMTQEELKRRGWEVERRKLVRDQVERALNSDNDIIMKKLSVSLQKEKVDTLDSIIKMVMNRNFSITAAINWVKFKSGVS